MSVRVSFDAASGSLTGDEARSSGPEPDVQAPTARHTKAAATARTVLAAEIKPLVVREPAAALTIPNPLRVPTRESLTGLYYSGSAVKEVLNSVKTAN